MGFVGGFSAAANNNRIWIAFYSIAASVLLVADSLWSTDHRTISLLASVIALLAASLAGLWLWFRRSKPAAIAVLVVSLSQAYFLTKATPFVPVDILLGPGIVWLASVGIAALFAAGLGRLYSFNEDLTPQISTVQRRLFNFLASAVIMATGVTYLILPSNLYLLRPSTNLLDPSQDRLALLDSLGKFAAHLPTTPGWWGMHLSVLTVKDILSIIYVLLAGGILAWWGLRRLNKRNGVPGFSLHPPQRLSIASPQRELELQHKLSFLFTFAGISFLFGLHAPLLFVGGHLNYQYLVIFSLFLIGGVGTWITALELSTVKGTLFTTGFLSGTLLIYLPTTVIGYLLVASILPVLTDIYILGIALQFGLGGMLILTGFLMAPLPGEGVRSIDLVRYTAGTTFVLTFAHFWWISTAPRLPSVLQSAFAQTLAFAIAVGGLVFLPIFGRSNRGRIRTVLVAPNNLAIAPLVAGADWDMAGEVEEENFRDFRAKREGHDEGDQIRLYTYDSEEEIKYYTSPPLSARLLLQYKRPDMVIVDLPSALSILSRTKHRGGRYSYLIRHILGGVPWRALRWDEPGRQSYNYFPGFVPYDPSNTEIGFLPSAAPTPHILTGFSGIASYLLLGVEPAAAILPEPHASAVELRRVTGTPRLIRVERVRELCVSSHLSPLFDLMPYVVMSRNDVVESREERAVLEVLKVGIDRLRQDVYMVDVDETYKITEFLNWHRRFKLEPIETNKGLHSAKFGADLSELLSTETSLSEAIVAFAKQLGVSQVDDLRSIIDNTGSAQPVSWWKPTSAEPDEQGGFRETPLGRSYLMPLIIVWLPNKPGKLDQVLAAISDVDLLFVGTANVGKYGLSYLLPKSFLPELGGPLGERSYDIIKPIRPGRLAQLPKIESMLIPESCLVTQVSGLLLKVHDTPEGLRQGIRGLLSDLGKGDLNLENVLAFSHRGDLALCFLMMSEKDLKETVERLNEVSRD